MSHEVILIKSKAIINKQETSVNKVSVFNLEQIWSWLELSYSNVAQTPVSTKIWLQLRSSKKTSCFLTPVLAPAADPWKHTVFNFPGRIHIVLKTEPNPILGGGWQTCSSVSF